MTNLTGSKHFRTATPEQKPVEVDEDEVDLRALTQTLWRRKLLIASTTLLAILIGGYYAYAMATPLYRATSVVLLETQQESVLDLQSVVGGLSGDDTEINSQLQVLKSRSLIGKVVDRLDLVSDSEFNGRLRKASLRDQIKTQVKQLVGLPDIDPVPSSAQIRSGVVSSLIEQINVSNVPRSLVIEITAETESPEKSALIADTLAELYILNQLQVKFEATEQASAWLSERVAELQVELENAEAAAAEFSASTDLVSMESLQALERQLKDLRDRIADNRTAILAAEARAQALQDADTLEEQARLANDPQLDRLLARSGDSTTIAEAVQTRIQQVIAQAGLELRRLEQQQAALLNSEAELQQRIGQQSEDLIRLQQLNREAEATRLLYEHFLTRLKETSAQQGIQQADARVLSSSVIPTIPSFPQKSRILALAGLLGLMLGAGYVLLREAANNSFRTAQDLEKHAGYSVLGQIPLIPARNRRKALNYLVEKPTSAAAEAVRNLRTSVLLTNVDNPPQVIVSTSSVPGEGKTTNSLALAQNFVGLGKKVLLIEGDIRRRTFAQYFDRLPRHGLVSVLAGQVEVEQAIFRPDGFEADVLVGEKTSTNAADLFSSDRFKALVEDMRGRYDAIIIDTPPVLVVPDARIISQAADAVLFTVHWDKTTRQQVDEALRLFHNSNQRISGFVLSQISPKGMKRYGYGGRYGAYAGYGAKYYDT